MISATTGGRGRRISLEAAFPSAEAVEGAIRQIEVHDVVSRIAFEIVEDQARSFQHGFDPGL
jgi:hypothetical protein